MRITELHHTNDSDLIFFLFLKNNSFFFAFIHLFLISLFFFLFILIYSLIFLLFIKIPISFMFLGLFSYFKRMNNNLQLMYFAKIIFISQCFPVVYCVIFALNKIWGVIFDFYTCVAKCFQCVCKVSLRAKTVFLI